MPNILNIDTSSSICSVALAKEGEVVLGYESSKKMDHSTSLAPFVEKCLDFLRDRNESLDAVSVTSGPGSYTGLRIGMSLAKGIAFGLEIPLITLSSLEVMAVRAIFTYPGFSGEEIVIPMIDARRMEVYTGVFDSSLNLLEPEKALILDENSFKKFKNFDKIIFIGDGIEKFKDIYQNKNAIWLGDGMPHAKYMVAISEKYFRENKFSDVAYSVPSYLKEYQATTPKQRL
ncbi:MAG: tRNA (adenosine(37)-N6)-threonylcarbamoyltransferase complex dimerization subunit type 1 TsaB [Muribaculaceae bacterium]|nr:tRNA (adenosine(37)-N6)-threonylcarbamoyltransferase complex dimerization subunit type 1 TsaB [Muribaculaceae bacterium]